MYGYLVARRQFLFLFQSFFSRRPSELLQGVILRGLLVRFLSLARYNLLSRNNLVAVQDSNVVAGRCQALGLAIQLSLPAL